MNLWACICSTLHSLSPVASEPKLCGIALIAVGVGTLLKYEDVLDAFKDINVNVAPIGFIVIGSAIFLIAFFGCCGAIFESECMILTYAVLLFLLLVAQIVVGVLVFTNKREVQRVSERILNNLWRDRQNHRAFWDTIQQGLKCCGLHSATEWIPNTPPSCCETNAIECVALVNAYGQGCSASLHELITDGSTIFGSTAIAVAAVELVGFIFACCLSNHIRNYKRRYM
ncbi:23 kDa integral membrane protein-like isoform X3 [Sitodiplosis mosellana]|uniref:23 kDa integral membrane protein-like isoform X3 n=1 Tax=Sitodiplosis mosellana TaxID=263140 RepID=UPI002444565D|nr:23 kDa integral membrane protein-like isoform X3 [Sitodiplosis mosellana]